MSERSSSQQAAAIPFRRNDSSVEVCLIRRKDSEAWGTPKGQIDPGESPEETALKETWEEAGLRGRLVGDSIGTYEYDKSGTSFTVTVYLLEVHEQADRWPEENLRERRWLPIEKARSLLSGSPVRSVLDRAIGALVASPRTQDTGSPRPQLNEGEAKDFIGKTVLVGVTYVDHQEKLIGRQQWYGVIREISSARGIVIALDGDTRPCVLPPDLSALRPAKPGEYRLRSTGKVIVNPDFLTTWTCQEPDPKAKPPR